ncbi:hypothetical protein [Paraburkholderia graminis]|uniref:hypothetical protein n=1 Tax=Paraburkholderia graminis TaxID=60548 RepID=UPI0038B89E82
MESDPSKFRVSYIRPRNDFGSFDGVLELAAKSASRAADGSSHRIELVESAADIRVNPRLFELPLIALIVDLAAAVVAEPTLFLADTALASRSLTGDTVRTYAEALIPWLCYVDDSELTLNDVTEETICVYRARVSHMAKRGTDVPYASATVNQRVVVPAMFHEWGQRKNIMPSSLGKFLCTADPNVAWRAFPFSSRYRVSRLQRIATPRVIARLPVSLSINEIQRLFLVTPMPYRLMLKWSVASGFLPTQLQVRKSAPDLRRA